MLHNFLGTPLVNYAILTIYSLPMVASSIVTCIQVTIEKKSFRYTFLIKNIYGNDFFSIGSCYE